MFAVAAFQPNDGVDVDEVERSRFLLYAVAWHRNQESLFLQCEDGLLERAQLDSMTQLYAGLAQQRAPVLEQFKHASVGFYEKRFSDFVTTIIHENEQVSE